MELTEKPQSGHEYAETLLAAANKEQRKNGKYNNECFEKDARFPFTASFPRPGTPVIILCILH